ncbi:hypothetical protein GCM10009547_19160 [Sporichthya brevicatena]|uniref:DNA-binding protein n=1 Tax=Sporichthya brevicatena TaxID=171442 RepID=A0ABN1GR79_9ACTN
MSTPVAAELFASLEPLTLAGSRCTTCRTVQFPRAAQCAHCAGEAVEVIDLPTTGRVWTWTVQRFAPKAPYVPPANGFAPYAVGYVDLGEVLVESILRYDLERGLPAIGDEVTLVAVPADGENVTYAFAPVGAA